MATIKIGQQGDSIVAPSYARPGPQVRVGEGIAALGQTLQRMGQQKQREADEAEKTQMMVRSAEYDSSLNDLTNDVLDKERSGELDANGLDEYWKQEAEIRQQQFLESVPENRRDRYRPLFELRTLDANGKFITAQRGRIAERSAQATENVLEANADIARKDPWRAIFNVETLLFSKPKDFKDPEATRRAFTNVAWTSNVRDKLEAPMSLAEVRELWDPKTGKGMLDDDNQFPGLDGDNRTKLKKEAESKIRQMKADYEAANAGALAVYDNNLAVYNKDVSSGRKQTAQERQQWETYINGAPDKAKNKKEAQMMFELQDDITAMALMGPTERAKEVNKRQAAVGAAANVQQRADALIRHDIFEKVQKNFDQMTQDNPIALWELSTDQNWPVYDPRRPLLEQLVEATQPAANVKGVTKRQPGLVRPEFAPAVAEALRLMPEQAAVQFFNDMTKPETPITPEALMATIDTIAKHDGLLGTAMRYGVKKAVAVNGDGEMIAPKIMRGARELKAGNVKVPESLDKEFDKHTGNFYAGFPDARASDLEAAKAYWAASPRNPKDLPEKSFREAIDSTIGKSVTKNGQRIYPPVNMKSSNLSYAWDQALTKSFEKNQLPQLDRTMFAEFGKPAMTNADGVYKLLYNGRYILVDLNEYR